MLQTRKNLVLAARDSGMLRSSMEENSSRGNKVQVHRIARGDIDAHHLSPCALDTVSVMVDRDYHFLFTTQTDVGFSPPKPRVQPSAEDDKKLNPQVEDQDLL